MISNSVIVYSCLMLNITASIIKSFVTGFVSVEPFKPLLPFNNPFVILLPIQTPPPRIEWQVAKNGSNTGFFNDIKTKRIDSSKITVKQPIKQLENFQMGDIWLNDYAQELGLEGLPPRDPKRASNAQILTIPNHKISPTSEENYEDDTGLLRALIDAILGNAHTVDTPPGDPPSNPDQLRAKPIQGSSSTASSTLAPRPNIGATKGESNTPQRPPSSNKKASFRSTFFSAVSSAFGKLF